MKVYEVRFKQHFKRPIEEIWSFFSSPTNLALITPENMAFVVTSTFDKDQEMYPGMIITYHVSPLLGLKLNWMTEITAIDPLHYFIDEQRFGPFKFWHHEHHFKKVHNGTEMTDILTYGMPFGPIGTIAHHLVVEKRIKEIFAFREAATQKIFG